MIEKYGNREASLAYLDHMDQESAGVPRLLHDPGLLHGQDVLLTGLLHLRTEGLQQELHQQVALGQHSLTAKLEVVKCRQEPANNAGVETDTSFCEVYFLIFSKLIEVIEYSLTTLGRAS